MVDCVNVKVIRQPTGTPPVKSHDSETWAMSWNFPHYPNWDKLLYLPSFDSILGGGKNDSAILAAIHAIISEPEVADIKGILIE